MQRIHHFLIYSILLMLPLLTQAETSIAGIHLPDRYTLNQKTLLLNGGGIRSKFFIKLYVGALYVAQKSPDAGVLIKNPDARSMQMFILYKELPAEKLASAWTEGFRDNVSEAQFGTLRQRVDQFNGLFKTLHKGDVVRMDYAPETGTTVSINDKPAGSISGKDFSDALLSIWIGENPADDDLKEGLLGG